MGQAGVGKASLLEVLGDGGIVDEGRSEVGAVRRGGVPRGAGGGLVTIENAGTLEEVHWLRWGEETAGSRGAQRGW